MKKFIVVLIGSLTCNLANAANQKLLWCVNLPNNYNSSALVEQGGDKNVASASIIYDDKAWARLSCSDVRKNLEDRGTASCAGVYLNDFSKLVDGLPADNIDTVVILKLTKRDGKITGVFNASKSFGKVKTVVTCTQY